jgi:hypothetical protein
VAARARPFGFAVAEEEDLLGHKAPFFHFGAGLDGGSLLIYN